MELRLKVLIASVGLGFLLLFGRFTQLQILQHNTYASLSDAQLIQQEAKKLKRGDIYFHKKDELVLAATERTEYTLALVPSKITDTEAVFRYINVYTPMARDEFAQKIKDKSDPYVPVLAHIDAPTRTRMMENVPKGIAFVDEENRYYPGGSLAAHVLGFFGESKDGRRGKYGVEQYYDSVLQEGNIPEAPWWQNLFHASKWYHAGSKDLVLTIDVGVQQQSEKILSDLMERTNGLKGGMMVYEPSTGRILSLAVAPTFNPNTYYETKDFETFINPFVQNTYELGSVFKPLTMSMAIDARAVTPETTYDDKGFRVIDTARISNYDGKGRGVVKMQEILSQSLNTGTVFLAERMGKGTFRSYVDKLQFGERTGVDLAGEVPGNLSNLAPSPRFIETATASFGQGIGLSPLSLASALGAIANKGELMTPYVVDEVRGNLGDSERKEPVSRGRIFTPETAETVTRMLVSVVDENLANGEAVIPGVTQAAKTGTAQIAARDGGGYKGEFLHAFFGYAPAYEPRFLVFIFVERPHGFQYASQSLTPSYLAMMKFLLGYYDVPPDRP